MCPKRYGLRKRLPTLMTIRRVNGARSAVQKRKHKQALRSSAATGKNRHQLLWRNHFELSIGAVARLFVCAPPSKLGHVTEAGALHMLVRDFDHKFGAQRLP